MMHSSGLDQLRRSLQLDVEGLNKNLGSLDSRLDKQRFFEANNSSFMIPKKFEYNPVRRDETETLVHKSVLDELEVRKRKLQERLATLKGRFLKFSIEYFWRFIKDFDNKAQLYPLKSTMKRFGKVWRVRKKHSRKWSRPLILTLPDFLWKRTRVPNEIQRLLFKK